MHKVGRKEKEREGQNFIRKLEEMKNEGWDGRKDGTKYLE